METVRVGVDTEEFMQKERNLAKSIVDWALCGCEDSHGQPIAEHCIRVGDRLRLDDAPQGVVLAGYLHDLLEDAPPYLPARHMLDVFGWYVVHIVTILTRGRTESYENYIGRVLADRQAALVKLYDMADNMDESRGPVPGHLAERYAKYWPKLLAATGPIKRFS